MSARSMPAIALTLALVTGCGEDPVKPTNPLPTPTLAEGLTDVEAVSLFRGITRLSLVDAIHPGSLVIQCPQGGQVEVIETLDEFQEDKTDHEIGVALTVMPTACRMRSEGNPFVVDGNPSLRIHMDVQIVTVSFREIVRITGTIAGDLDWQLHRRSGGCPVLGMLTAWANVLPDPDTPGTGGYFSGSVCGHDVKIDMSESLTPLHFPT